MPSKLLDLKSPVIGEGVEAARISAIKGGIMQGIHTVRVIMETE